MISKLSILFAVLLNLATWNYFLIGSWGTFFTSGYFIVMHLTISGLVVILFWYILRRFRDSRHPSLLLLLPLSILAAYLPPVITVWLTFSGPGILTLHFDGVFSSFYVAIVLTGENWKYWIPLSIANFFLLYVYLNKHGNELRS